MIDHSTEPFPEPVAPATRMCCPNTGSCHHLPVSVAPTPTPAEFTMVWVVGRRSRIGVASASP